MADTYTTTLGAILMAIGGDNNTWGTNLNNSVIQILEDAIANALPSATATVTGGTLDLSINAPPAGPSAARYAFLPFTGTLTANQIVKVPNLTKSWLVRNGTSGGFTLSLETPSGTPQTIPQNNGWQLVTCDGANNIVVWPFNTAQIEMANGAAAAPAFSFLNETGSGWYRNGTQDIRLAVAGADVLQVTGPSASTPSVMNLLAGVLQVGGAQVIPPGTEQAYAGIQLPAGWLWEDGSSVSRTTYANLFNALTITATATANGTTSLTGLSADLRGLGLNGAIVEGSSLIASNTTITFTGASTATLSQAATGSGSITIRVFPWGNGNGSTTFNVPDRRDMVLAGRGDMNLTSDRGLLTSAGSGVKGTQFSAGGSGGQVGGAETETLTVQQIPAHTHGYSGTTGAESATHTHQIQQSTTATFGSGSFAGASQPTTVNTSTESQGHTHSYSGTTDNGTGGGQAHPNVQPTGITNWIIKT